MGFDGSVEWGVYCLGSYSLGVYSLGYSLGGCSLGVYSLGVHLPERRNDQEHLYIVDTDIVFLSTH